MKSTLSVLVLGAVVLFAHTVQGQSLITPGSMPSAERIFAEVKGDSPMDTAARQMGAFWHLRQVVETLAGQRRLKAQWTAEERGLLGAYISGYQKAGAPYAKLIDTPEQPKWYQMHAFHETDDGFRDEVLERFVAPPIRDAYLRAKGIQLKQAVGRGEAAQRERARVQVELKAGGPGSGAPQPAAPPPVVRPPQAALAATESRIDVPPAPPRPSGPKNSVLVLQAESRGTFYLLDDDFESILKRAGFHKETLLGMELPLLNSFEMVMRWKATTDDPLMKMLTGGQSALPEDLEQQYARGTKALREHTVATITTDRTRKATVPALAAGTYYVYGTTSRFVKTGARGTISGDTVTLHDTGIDAATIWNLKVEIKPGRTTVALTRDNAAFVSR